MKGITGASMKGLSFPCASEHQGYWADYNNFIFPKYKGDNSTLRNVDRNSHHTENVFVHYTEKLNN